MNLSSPNAMVWSTFRSLDRIAQEVENSEDKNYIKDKVAISLVLSVTVVETFLNMFFRILIENPKYQEHKEMVLNDLDLEGNEKRKGLKYKLNNWPNKVLNKNINFDKGVAKEFDEIRQKRNALMHFTSKYEPISIPGVEIKGLANTEVFDNLKKEDALKNALIARDFIGQVLTLGGTSEKELPHAMHHWLGIVPEIES